MPRGKKICPHCNFVCGPRSYFCLNKACGKPFTMKGVLATEEKRVELAAKAAGTFGKPPGEVEQEEVYLNIYDYFEDVDPTERELSVGGEDTHCYLSKDHRFKLRRSEEFMGVPLEKLHDRWYTLLHRNTDRDSTVLWELVRRFKSMNAALHYYKAVEAGERELVLYRPGDDQPKSRMHKRVAKRAAKLAKRNKVTV